MAARPFRFHPAAEEELEEAAEWYEERNPGLGGDFALAEPEQFSQYRVFRALDDARFATWAH